MTPEQQDEARWFAGGQDLANRVDAALTAIMGRRVPWALTVWPHANKTLFSGTATDATIREGFQSVIDKYDTMRTKP